jgi:hypothetical protein
MCALVGTAFAVIRRLGANRSGAMLGASLFIVAGSAAHGWVRLTMAEVVGTQLLLIGLLIALDFQRAPRWWRHVGGLTIIVVALVLTKEMFIATIPLLVAIALCWQPDDMLRMARVSRRNIAACLACGIGALATAVPVGLVALNAPAGAYTSTFGTEGFPWFRPVVWITGAATPYLVVSWRNPAWALAQLLVLGAVTIVGLRSLIQDPMRRGHYRALLVVLGLHVVAGALLYLPWPVYQPFYAMPFLIAPAAAMALAITGTQRSSRGLDSSSVLALAGWGFVLLSATVQAVDYRRSTDAEQRFNAELVRFVAERHSQFDSLVVVNKRSLRGARSWQGFGATIARYGNAMSYTMPSVVDEDCATARVRRLTSHATTLLLRYGNTCASMGRPDTVIVRRYRQFDWDRFRPSNDSLFAELYKGLDGGAP